MDSVPSNFLQPTLHGATLSLRPLASGDFEALYQAAADPLVWAGHPSKLRYQRPVFEEWFRDALACGGTLVVTDRASGEVAGSSRYYDWHEDAGEIAIGYTFLARNYWGGAANAEMKGLMLEHAFRSANTVWFHVATENIRSRKAMEKIGGVLSHQGIRQLTGGPAEYCFYKIDRESHRTRLAAQA